MVDVRLYNPPPGSVNQHPDERPRDGGTWGPFEDVIVTDSRVIVIRSKNPDNGGWRDGLGEPDRPTYELAHRTNTGTWLENWPSCREYSHLYIFGL